MLSSGCERWQQPARILAQVVACSQRGTTAPVRSGSSCIVCPPCRPAKLLRTRFGAVPEKAALKVRAADAATLDLWAERVLTAHSLAEALETRAA
jgi:hypothetical protein